MEVLKVDSNGTKVGLAPMQTYYDMMWCCKQWFSGGCRTDITVVDPGNLNKIMPFTLRAKGII